MMNTKPRIIGMYNNGNCSVIIYNNGTKVRSCFSKPRPKFAESIDLTITKKCDGDCGFCYMGCTKDAPYADILHTNLFKGIHPYTELAIGGNDLSHPQLIPFLEMVKKNKVIVNITVNQKHFMKNLELLHYLQDNELIYGIGISLVKSSDIFIAEVKRFPNAIIHVINGIISKDDLMLLWDKGLKILILGYKSVGRGEEFLYENIFTISSNRKYLYDTLVEQLNHFDVVSFDNLALTQLKVKRFLSEGEYNKFYMGDEGQFTYYIDMVNRTFARDSMTNVRYSLLSSLDEMFKVIQAHV